MAEILLSTLRDRLYEEPSRALWCELWSLLSEAEARPAAEEVDAAIGYAVGHMGEWPVSMRKICLRRLGEWLPLPPPMAWPLVQQVEIYLRPQDLDALAAWTRSPWCWPIQGLTLRLDTLSSAPYAVELSEALLAELLDSPAFSQLSRLKISNIGLEAGAVERLCQDPRLAELTQLDLVGAGIAESEAALLAESPHLSGLTQLNLCINEIGDHGLGLLLNSEHLRQLSSLLLQSNQLTEAAYEIFALAPSQGYAPWERLYLGMNPMRGGSMLSSLAGSDRAQELKHLDVRRNVEDVDALGQLAGLPCFPKLEVLGLQSALASPEAYRCLSRLLPPPALRTLWLGEMSHSQGFEGDEAFAHLAQSPLLHQIEKLDLSYLNLGDASLELLAENPCIKQLTDLSLGSNYISHQGLRRFFAAEGWGRSLQALHLDRIVETADLSMVMEGDPFITALVESPTLASLRRLSYNDNWIGPADAHALGHCPHFSGLEHLSVERNSALSPGVDALLDSPLSEGLLGLQMAGVVLGESSLALLASHPHLSSLQVLSMGPFSEDYDPEPPLAQLLASKSLPQLMKLRIATDGHLVEGLQQRAREASDLVHMGDVDVYLLMPF